MNQINEKGTWHLSGFLMALVELALLASWIYLIVPYSRDIEGGKEIAAGIVCLVGFIFGINGFFVVQPIEARVLFFPDLLRQSQEVRLLVVESVHR